MAQRDQLDAKDKAFSRFLLDLPALPPNLLSFLQDLCLDPDVSVTVLHFPPYSLATTHPPLLHAYRL